MHLDPVRCHRAFVRHDRRYDGRIFGAVVTTGVYCRPVCPVRPAKLENCRFFACAAAAEAAGFRPCRRCRPETAPGTPAWMGTSAVVSRACRLISAGALDGDDAEALAARLGVGGRHLRRLFGRHLGASPAQIARARRVHFARALLDETDLRMTAIALAAGFRSIRQFNHAVRATFRASPTTLRRMRHGSTSAAALVLRLPYRRPFDWTAMLDFFRTRAIPGVEVVDGDVYRRTIELGGAVGAIEVRDGGERAHLLMRVDLSGHDHLLQVVERVRRLFGLDEDPHEVERRLCASAVLRPLVKRTPGLRVPGAWDAFELAVRAVLGQQVTVRGASTLAGRLVRAFGTPIRASDGLTHLFPRPETLAQADVGVLGMPRARATTIRALAEAVAAGALVLDAARGLDDAIARLRAIPGIGPWTAEYVAMRALGETDAFPVGDLGLRRALGNGAGPLSAGDLARLAEAWRPRRASAAMHLWRSLAGGEEGRWS